MRTVGPATFRLKCTRHISLVAGSLVLTRRSTLNTGITNYSTSFPPYPRLSQPRPPRLHIMNLSYNINGITRSSNMFHFLVVCNSSLFEQINHLVTFWEYLLPKNGTNWISKFWPKFNLSTKTWKLNVFKSLLFIVQDSTNWRPF